MEQFRTVDSLRAFLSGPRASGAQIGFVPTMGAFHEGHLSLMRRAKTECDLSVVSLFVNPTQFAAGEDFDRYPRDLEADSKLAKSAGVDALFVPAVVDMYPDGPAVTVRVDGLSERWEGARRPGHFDGVATVCTKLFNIVQPDRAYFGQKDYQQLKVIQRVARALHLPIEIVPSPTVREPDGLAMSSRNAYLTAEERAAAPAINRALVSALRIFQNGERSADALTRSVRDELNRALLLSEDYIGVADSETLEPLSRIESAAVLLIAARLGSTRLIDNILLPPA